MIKQLQKKFILSSMLAISILLLVVLGGINIFNTVSIKKKTNKLLTTLAQVENSAITLMLPQVRDSWDFFSSVVTQDDTLGAIYFVAREDNAGHIRTVDISHISSISKQDAIECAKQARRNGDSAGRVGRFKYMSVATVGNLGKTYIFLDVTEQVGNIWRVLFLSVGIGVLCWGAMLLLTILLSKKAIKPIAANIEKQKQFVTDAGHEIKTPLAIIMANTDAMELCYGENKYSKNIRSQIFRLKDLTQDMLSLAKMEERPETKIKECFSMTSLVEEMVGFFSENIGEKQILLRTNFQPDVKIHSNREKVERLVSILMDNASRYTNPGGCIDASLTQSGKQVIFCISNTAENLGTLQPEKIFDRFYRGDDARTQKSGGSGIGLSAAHAIVQALKGAISVRIENNERIHFMVKLPIE